MSAKGKPEGLRFPGLCEKSKDPKNGAGRKKQRR